MPEPREKLHVAVMPSHARDKALWARFNYDTPDFPADAVSMIETSTGNHSVMLNQPQKWFGVDFATADEFAATLRTLSEGVEMQTMSKGGWVPRHSNTFEFDPPASILIQNARQIISAGVAKT